MMFLPFFTSTCIATPSLEKKKLHTKPSLHSKTVWQLLGVFAVFSGQDLIANLSDGIKIMDSSFITCDDIGKQSFCHKLETCEAAF